MARARILVLSSPRLARLDGLLVASGASPGRGERVDDAMELFEVDAAATGPTVQVRTRGAPRASGKVRTKVRELDVKNLSRFELEQLALQNAQRVQDLESAAQGVRDLLSPT